MSGRRRRAVPALIPALLLIGALPAEVTSQGVPAAPTSARAAAPRPTPEMMVVVRERVDSLFAVAAGAAGTRAAAATLAAAEREARAYQRAWGDAFLLAEVGRFRSWTRTQRATRVAATQLRRAGNRALGRGGPGEAMSYWRASLALGEMIPDTAGMAAATGNLGVAFHHAWENDSARAYLERARALAASAGDRQTELNAAGVLALIEMDEGRVDEARSRFEATLALRRRSGDLRGIASDHNNLGLVAEREARLDQARAHYGDALQVARAHGLSEPAAAALTNLAGLDVLAGDHAGALSGYREALELYRQLGHSLDEALVLRNIGLAHMRAGEYTAAIASLERAVLLCTDAAAVPELMETREDLLQARLAVGDLPGAARELEAAEALAHEQPEDGVIAARLELLRGDVAFEFNDHALAERHYRNARARFHEAGDAWGSAAAATARGFVLLLRGDAAAAEALLVSAAREQSELGDERQAAWTRILVGRAQRERGRAPAAAATIESAATLLDRLGDAGGTAAARAALAEVPGIRPEHSLPEMRRAVVGLAPGTAPAIEAQLRAGIGRLLLRQHREEEGIAELQRAVNLLEDVAGRLAPEARRYEYLADKWTVYADLAEATHAAGDVQAAFRTSERMRARMLLHQVMPDQRRAARIVPAATTTRTADQRGTWRERLRNAFTRTNAAAAGGSTPRLAVAERDAPRATERTRLGSLGEVRAAASGSAEPVRPVGADDVMRRLGPGEVMLNYLVTDSAVLLFVVSRDSTTALRLPVTRYDLGRAIDFARGVIRSSAFAGGDAWEAPLARLYDGLVRPAEAAGLLAGARSLVIVPHAELHYLPFAALLDRSRGEFLVERYALTHAPSATLWLTLPARRPGAGPKPRTVLAMAPNPRQLPASRPEVERIARVPGFRARSVIGRAASETAFREAAPGFDILHLATRATLDRRLPLFSAIELNARGSDDGLLEVHEVARMRLGARLVVLSACETALGAGGLADVPPGDDWIGLVAAFLHAGAAQVLATLWPVEDAATARWMGAFYDALAGGAGEVEALAAAQRAAVKTRDMRHPYYWAGFTLSGSRGQEGGS